MSTPQDELNNRLFSHFSFNPNNAKSSYISTPLDTLNNKSQMIDTTKSMNKSFDVTVEEKIRTKSNTLNETSELYSQNKALEERQKQNNKYFASIEQGNKNALISVQEKKIFNNASRF
ncbi:MAG: hypothetical protein CMF82_03800 [Candidatus Marinimicrobia bacterium]|nr:hypothetical protein [Candidatus Neomarinimicrobiota bacterium]|tara:strand:+ start:76 stop:429 length:354 start_codon:yes stop_codon:yes gene_type:complete